VLSDLAVSRDQGELFGPVTSHPTLWRTLHGIGDLQRDKLALARRPAVASVLLRR
jgi:hypothetical protein